MKNSSSKREKIQKYLARCGVGSRRGCEEVVSELRVTVNGTVASIGQWVNTTDDIRLDGSRLKPPRPLYYKLYKPKGFLCTDRKDQKGRLASELLPNQRERLFSLGRLDKDFEGLMIYTNDGDIGNRITHPRYQVEKIYEVRIHGYVKDNDINRIQKGVYLSEGRVKPLSIRIKKRSRQRTMLTIKLSENRRRLIPRVFAKSDYHVDKVKRIAIGPLKMSGLREGQARKLTADEIKSLKKLVSR